MLKRTKRRLSLPPNQIPMSRLVVVHYQFVPQIRLPNLRYTKLLSFLLAFAYIFSSFFDVHYVEFWFYSSFARTQFLANIICTTYLALRKWFWCTTPSLCHTPLWLYFVNHLKLDWYNLFRYYAARETNFVFYLSPKEIFYNFNAQSGNCTFLNG